MRDFFIKSKTERLIKQRHVNVDKQAIRSVGILVGNSVQKQVLEAIINDFARSISLTSNQITFLYCTKDQKEISKSSSGEVVPYIETGILGGVKDEKVLAFLNNEFDCLINIYTRNQILLNYLTARCKAKFKIGLSGVDYRLFDLILQFTDYETIFKEVVIYLKAMGKVHQSLPKPSCKPLYFIVNSSVMKKLLGTGVALVTPFNEDLSVDFESLKKLVKHVIPYVDYLVILGTTGESVTLSADEKKQVTQTIIDANTENKKMVLGVGGNNTATLVESLRNTDLSQFEAILSVTPYYNKPTQHGLYEHYKAIATNSPVPVILYNVPGRTGVNLSADTVGKLANEFSNIIGIKEATGHFLQGVDTLKKAPIGFNMISGDDPITLSMMLHGGVGAISVLGQAFPKTYSDMVNAALDGDYKTANSIFYDIYDVIKLMFEEGNPTGIKSLLKLLGICESKTVRLPLVEGSEQLDQKLMPYTNFK